MKKIITQILVIICLLSAISCIKITGTAHKVYHANNQLNRVKYETAKSISNTHYHNYLEKVYYGSGILKLRRRYKGPIMPQTGVPRKAITRTWDEDGDIMRITIYKRGKLIKQKR